jgi:F-type H+-transporting ATPase subunit b
MPQLDTSFFSSLLFWSIISFTILLFLLKRYALPPILEMLDQREARIRDSLESAARAREEAEKSMAEYQERMKEAWREAEATVRHAKSRAQQILDENERRIRDESERVVADAKQQIEREQRHAVEEVKRIAADLSILAAERVIKKNLRAEDQRRLAEEAIEEFSQKYRAN